MLTAFFSPVLAAAAAYPVVAATNTSTFAFGASSPRAANLPASISSGDLLLLFAVSNGASHSVTTPAGWTLLFGSLSAAANHFLCWYKVASGSEGSTVNITVSSTSSITNTLAYRITGYQATPEAGTTATGSSSTADPPSLSPSWGSSKTLWLAVSENHGGVSFVSSYPTNYTGGISAATGGIGIASAQRELTAASENPGVLTWNASGAWSANTVAIRPA